MGAGFDKRAHGLKPVHVQKPGRPALHLPGGHAADRLRPAARRSRTYLLPHHLNDCKIAAQIDIIEEGNWKLTMENNRECYHCAANHQADHLAVRIRLRLSALGRQRAAAGRLRRAVATPGIRMAGRRTALIRTRLSGRAHHRLPRATPAAGPRRRIGNPGRPGGLAQAAGQFSARRPGRAVVLDAAQRLVPLHERPHRHLLGAADRARKDPGAHHLAGAQDAREHGTTTSRI